MPLSNKTIIDVENLSYKIKSKTLLDSVSLKINAGERIALIGANGAGKTSLARCLLGLLGDEKANIKIHGKPLNKYSRAELAKLISYVPQQLPDTIIFSVKEFIMMSRYTYELGTACSDPDGEKVALEVMERLNIQHLRNQSVSTLSGGERQKVSIAAALIQQTSIIILDEPSAHLDPKQTDDIYKTLKNICPTITLIIITHDMNWAATQFDRSLGMLDGKLIINVSAEKLLTTENMQLLFGTSWRTHSHPDTGKTIILPSS